MIIIDVAILSIFDALPAELQNWILLLLLSTTDVPRHPSPLC